MAIPYTQLYLQCSSDGQLDVRENAAVMLGGLLHCGYLDMNATLLVCTMDEFLLLDICPVLVVAR
jgi:hypothetical protein